MTTTAHVQHQDGLVDPPAEVALLSAEAEVDLAKAIEAGLYAGHLLEHGAAGDRTAELREVVTAGRAAFARFVEANVRLAAWHARRRAAVSATGGLTIEDLTNEGVLGVIRAVQKFDYALGYKFSTYASRWIRNFQQRAVIAASPATLDAADREQCAAMLSERQYLAVELGRIPTPAEIAAAMGTTVRALSQWQGMIAPAYSLDGPLGSDSDFSIGDTLAAPEPANGEALRAPRRVSELLVVLTDRERSVVRQMFGLDTGVPTALAEVAATRKVASERVAAVVETALTKLRSAATSEVAA
jgi:RNA polymerase sigma factor (sigma-70 family)